MATTAKETLFHLVCQAIRQGVVRVDEDCPIAPVRWRVRTDQQEHLLWNNVLSLATPCTFILGGTRYPIMFNDNVRTSGRDVQYFRRGATFVDCLIKTVLRQYNLLVVDADIQSSVDVTASLPHTGQLSLLRQEIAPWHDAESAYRYRINFLLELKDTIEGSICNHSFTKGVSVQFDASGVPVYSTGMRIAATDTTVDEGDTYGDDAIPDIDDTQRTAVKQLAHRLEQQEEKDKVFSAIIADDRDDVAMHLARRIQLAERTDRTDYKIEYNVIPLTIYLDKIRRKQLFYRLTTEEGQADFDVVVDPTDDTFRATCPHCQAILAEGQHRLVVALDATAQPVVACDACTTMLDDCIDGGAHCVLNEAVVLVPSDTDGVQHYAHIADTFVSVLDDVRYHNRDAFTPDFYYRRVRGAKGDSVCSRHVYTCPNCQATYGVRPSLVGDFSRDVVLWDTDYNRYACVHCFNLPTDALVAEAKRELRPKYSFGFYENTGRVFSSLAGSRGCHRCHKVINIDDSQCCAGCGGYLCPDCYSQHRLCPMCSAAYLDYAPLQGKAARGLWRGVRANVPWRYRVLRHRLYQPKGHHAVYVRFDVPRRGRVTYVFEAGGDHRLLGCMDNSSKRYRR